MQARNPTTTNQLPDRESDPKPIWVISQGRYVDLDLSAVLNEVQTATVMDYRISELAYYLLSPSPIQVQKRLVGCEIHYRSSNSRLKTLLRKIRPGARDPSSSDAARRPRRLVSDLGAHRLSLKDEDLEAHFTHIYEQLRPYDNLIKTLNHLDLQTITDVTGLCRDMNGNLSPLKIQGDIAAKLDYIEANLHDEVGVILDKAYLSKGLFEMGGFSFQNFDPDKSYRLIKFAVQGKPRACVLGRNNTLIYWVDDIKLVYYIQILNQLLAVNPKLNESFELCRSGQAKALKLLFNRQVEIDYSAAQLPGIYKDVIERYKIESKFRDVIANVISNHQFAVLFNYIPRSDASEGRICTNLSLMHNLRALEALKEAVPQVYSEINNRVAQTEVGRYYLLDCFRGYQE